MSWKTICHKRDVDEDFPFGAKVGDVDIGVYQLDEEYYALENICPHAYALLTQGFVEDGQIECPLHEAMFDIKSGKCMREPADRDLQVYPIRVVGDQIEVKVD